MPCGFKISSVCVQILGSAVASQNTAAAAAASKQTCMVITKLRTLGPDEFSYINVLLQDRQVQRNYNVHASNFRLLSDTTPTNSSLTSPQDLHQTGKKNKIKTTTLQVKFMSLIKKRNQIGV